MVILVRVPHSPLKKEWNCISASNNNEVIHCSHYLDSCIEARLRLRGSRRQGEQEPLWLFEEKY